MGLGLQVGILADLKDAHASLSALPLGEQRLAPQDVFERYHVGPRHFHRGANAFAPNGVGTLNGLRPPPLVVICQNT